eukprot:jgi/Chlat1/3998/Chrsp26S03988
MALSLSLVVWLVWALLLLLTASSAEAQRNTEPWPSSTGYADVSDNQIPVDPSDRCDDVIARFSFTQPGQVVQTDFLPFVTPPGANCEGPPWHGLSIEAFFQTSDFVPANGIVGVWIGGVEIMRGLFPEGTFSAADSPDPRGTKRWAIEKSVTQFLSLMGKKQTATVSVVYNSDSNQYSPVLNATITLRYYNIDEDYYTNYPEDAAVFPPIVLPISQGGPNIAPWFTLAPSGGTGSATLRLPRNMVSASIEVIGVAVPGAPYLSTPVVERDKQVQVLVDGVTAGFAHIDTQRLHEPLALSFSVDITPMVLLVDGNLFIYVDKRANRTSGTLLESSTSGPFQLGPAYNPDCYVDLPYSCSYEAANSSVTLRGTVKSSAGVVYVNVTQISNLTVTTVGGYCFGVEVHLHVDQKTSRGNTPTRVTSIGHTESVYAYSDESCSDVGCGHSDYVDASYSIRRTTKQGVLLRKQYHHSRVSGSGTCEYSTEDDDSEFVYADYDKDGRCFTLNTTRKYDTRTGTTTTSVDTIECPPRS